MIVFLKYNHTIGAGQARGAGQGAVGAGTVHHSHTNFLNIIIFLKYNHTIGAGQVRGAGQGAVGAGAGPGGVGAAHGRDGARAGRHRRRQRVRTPRHTNVM